MVWTKTDGNDHPRKIEGYEENRYKVLTKTGQTKKVAIVDDKLLSLIEKGEIDFDILIATPDFMPKIAKFARIAWNNHDLAHFKINKILNRDKPGAVKCPIRFQRRKKRSILSHWLIINLKIGRF